MGALITASAAPAADDIRESVGSLDRATLEALIAVAIAEADVRDGDPDLEPEEDRCEAADDHTGPVSMRWRGTIPHSPDDVAVCGVLRRRPKRASRRRGGRSALVAFGR